ELIKFAGADQPLGLFGQGSVDREEVGALKQLAQVVVQLDLQLLCAMRGDVRVERSDAHAQALRPFRDERSDAAETYDAQPGTFELPAEERAVPPALPDQPVRA